MKFFFHVLDLFYSSAWLKTKYFLPSHLQIQDFFKYNFSRRGGDEFFFIGFIAIHMSFLQRFILRKKIRKKRQFQEAILFVCKVKFQKIVDFSFWVNSATTCTLFYFHFQPIIQSFIKIQYYNFMILKVKHNSEYELKILSTYKELDFFNRKIHKHHYHES